MELLTGKQLLAKVDSLTNSTLGEKAIACGYYNVGSYGEKRPMLNKFEEEYKIALILGDRMDCIDILFSHEDEIKKRKQKSREMVKKWKKENREKLNKLRQDINKNETN